MMPSGDARSTEGLVLVGLRGTGKTSVGKIVAGLLGRAFLDTDDLIVRRAGGRSIRQIFESHGEPHFRDLETQALAEATAEPGRVLATGGGIVLRPENRERLKQYGFVAWLTADPRVLAARLEADPRSAHDRPALTAAGTLAEIEAVLTARRLLYEAVASTTIDTGRLALEPAAEAVLAAWEGR